ncbi:MAG TPA: hypothetical protein VNO32_54955 [Candidatus Acidoferrum sp.]|nr:hypothetical protein [Candidatus Acidoferrum sp.]
MRCASSAGRRYYQQSGDSRIKPRTCVDALDTQVASYVGLIPREHNSGGTQGTTTTLGFWSRQLKSQS